MLEDSCTCRSAPGHGTIVTAQVLVHALNVPVYGELADTRSA
jgi:hypothetical protein